MLLFTGWSGLSAALVASTLAMVAPAQAEAPVHAGLSASERVDEFEGEFSTRIASFPDGTSETSHWLVRDGEAVELDVSPADHPELVAGNRLRVTGRRIGADRFAVQRLALVTSRTEPLIDPEPRTSRRVAFVMVHWGDQPTSPTAGEVTNKMFRSNTSVNAFYQQNSYGKDKIVGDVFGWYEIPDPGGCRTDLISLYARQAVGESGVDTSEYHHFMYFFPPYGPCAWAGLAGVGTPEVPVRDSWYNGDTGCVVLNQELGHNFGMQHSRSYSCRDGSDVVPYSDDCTESEYGDPYGPMGRGCGHMNVVQKSYMGWLEGCNIVTAPSDGVFSLLPTELPCNGTQSLRIPFADGLYYHLEYRQPLGPFDTGLAGVQVRVASDATGTVNPYIIDMDAEGSSWAIRAGQEYEDHLGRVRFAILEENPSHALIEVIYPDGGAGEATCADGSQPEAGVGYLGSLECADAPVGPDEVAPVASVIAPGDDDAFEIGASFDVVAEATDERGVAWVELYLNGAPVFKRYAPPYEWGLQNVSEGIYEFVVVASDGPNYVESEVVTVTVGDPDTGDTGSTDGTDGTDDEDDGDTNEDDGEHDGGDDTDAEAEDAGDDGGCACRQSDGRWPPLLPAMMTFVLLGARRRRSTAA